MPRLEHFVKVLNKNTSNEELLKTYAIFIP
jgi:acyl-CoA-binding protein